jgi:hypothetical protein
MNGIDARAMLQGLVERWHDHRSARAALAELEALDPSVVGEIARDVGLDAAELRDVIAKGAGADRLMLRMLAAFGLDGEALSRSDPRLMHDISVACSNCDEKGRCRRELADGTARQHAHEFCPNQPSFAALG